MVFIFDRQWSVSGLTSIHTGIKASTLITIRIQIARSERRSGSKNMPFVLWFVSVPHKHCWPYAGHWYHKTAAIYRSTSIKRFMIMVLKWDGSSDRVALMWKITLYRIISKIPSPPLSPPLKKGGIGGERGRKWGKKAKLVKKLTSFPNVKHF